MISDNFYQLNLRILLNHQYLINQSIELYVFLLQCCHSQLKGINFHSKFLIKAFQDLVFFQKKGSYIIEFNLKIAHFGKNHNQIQSVLGFLLSFQSIVCIFLDEQLNFKLSQILLIGYHQYSQEKTLIYVCFLSLNRMSQEKKIYLSNCLMAFLNYAKCHFCQFVDEIFLNQQTSLNQLIFIRQYCQYFLLLQKLN
ncbi:hypothetical protein TTHERM_000105639 (macronuclear) [Tetrahymena thermophila SB210]|uniref:Uncharacterized protein n=1 Tax=Tetrahymena thermophila (strain SB210) TaxID=312017 RepID=W7XL00_TETTS|nr:hypothetical protein TTHERM_000105639 [Tetrahymena thermophila SB210]EWS75424.1 hypothetical protein TTHERM_000105639 [Tetrahymena thermophila SB210]|eukprot:XP_012652098.1 hypothetical protein TTHERM_000105639 [Tetrahymena thermophila SB210]